MVITSISNHDVGRGFLPSFEDHLNNACTLPRCLGLVFSVPVGRNTRMRVRTKKSTWDKWACAISEITSTIDLRHVPDKEDQNVASAAEQA